MLFNRSPIHRPLEIFLELRDDEHGRRERQQKDDVHGSEGLGLEDHLQRWEINHQQLADQREADREQEHFVREQSDLKGKQTVGYKMTKLPQSGLTWKTLLVCERQLKAFHMSNSTKHVNVMVVSRLVLPPEPSSISR